MASFVCIFTLFREIRDGFKNPVTASVFFFQTLRIALAGKIGPGTPLNAKIPQISFQNSHFWGFWTRLLSLSTKWKLFSPSLSVCLHWTQPAPFSVPHDGQTACTEWNELLLTTMSSGHCPLQCWWSTPSEPLHLNAGNIWATSHMAAWQSHSEYSMNCGPTWVYWFLQHLKMSTLVERLSNDKSVTNCGCQNLSSR